MRSRRSGTRYRRPYRSRFSSALQLPVDERLVGEVADATPLDRHVELAPGRGEQPGAEREQGRLPGSVRPGDEQQIALGHVEVEIAEDALRAEAAAEPARSRSHDHVPEHEEKRT